MNQQLSAVEPEENNTVIEAGGQGRRHRYGHGRTSF